MGRGQCALQGDTVRERCTEHLRSPMAPTSPELLRAFNVFMHTGYPTVCEMLLFQIGHSPLRLGDKF